MKIITKEEFEHEKYKYQKLIKEGALFIYPTDTIYGLSCDATNIDAVRLLREIKQKEGPLSVHVPSKEWIKEHCILDEKWLEKLPGPYTLIVKVKSGAVCKLVNPGERTLGVRIPDHWTSKCVEECGFPIITTSVNKSSENFMTSAESIDPEIAIHIAFMISEGEKKGRPSTIIDKRALGFMITSFSLEASARRPLGFFH